MNKYIDVRGVHPVYIHGLVAVTLEGCNRNITVSEAEYIIAEKAKYENELKVEKNND